MKGSARPSMAVATITIVVLAGPGPDGRAQERVNLALRKTVTRSSDVSSGRAPNAVDGRLDTYWQPLMSDRQDDSNVWLRVDRVVHAVLRAGRLPRLGQPWSSQR